MYHIEMSQIYINVAQQKLVNLKMIEIHGNLTPTCFEERIFDSTMSLTALETPYYQIQRNLELCFRIVLPLAVKYQRAKVEAPFITKD